MSAIAFIIGGAVGLWCGFLWGYLSRRADDTVTMSDAHPIVQNFTRSSTTAQGRQ